MLAGLLLVNLVNHRIKIFENIIGIAQVIIPGSSLRWILRAHIVNTTAAIVLECILLPTLLR